jgi:anaerobic ribonucleoside-triphosphate reductase activating protein
MYNFHTLQKQRRAIHVAFINRIGYFYGDHPKYHSVSIYYQGCDRQPKCPMCHNLHTWEPFKGFEMTNDEIIESLIYKTEPLIEQGMTVALVFLGGEPLAPYNRDSTYEVSKFFKEKFGDKIVTTLYSWRMPVEIADQELLKFVRYIDEFVLGPYRHDMRNVDENGNILFPASTNQLYITHDELLREIKKLKEVLL